MDSNYIDSSSYRTNCSAFNTCDTQAADIHVEPSLLPPVTVFSPLVANEQQPITWTPHRIEPIGIHLTLGIK
jgi:hypothetical protein